MSHGTLRIDITWVIFQSRSLIHFDSIFKNSSHRTIWRMEISRFKILFLTRAWTSTSSFASISQFFLNLVKKFLSFHFIEFRFLTTFSQRTFSFDLFYASSHQVHIKINFFKGIHYLLKWRWLVFKSRCGSFFLFFFTLLLLFFGGIGV